MPTPPGSDELVFFVNGKKVTERDVDPEVTLLTFLRRSLGLTGTKSACAGGSCGACTVMLSRLDMASGKPRHVSVTACLVPLCSLHGVAVTTVEGVGSIRTRVHPVQERVARSHGTQCGFCTPGVVMSLYTLLRNHPQPSEEQLLEALAGNLCRCTGYRPILESGRTFCLDSGGCKQSRAGQCCLDEAGDTVTPPGSSDPQALMCSELLSRTEFQPWDPTQEPIFPPELMRMAESPEPRSLTFHGDRVTWVSPGTLQELLALRAQHPEAPLVLGNTALGPSSKSRGRVHPLLICPARVPELSTVIASSDGLTVGANCSLAKLQDVLAKSIAKLPGEKMQTLRALEKALRTLASQQVRNLASLGGHIMSQQSSSDLNPILAVGRATLRLLSEGGVRLIPLDEHFLAGVASAGLRPGEILESVHIPYSRKREFVSSFRQAQAPQNAVPHVSAGMRVLLAEGTNAIEGLSIAYGGVGATTVMAPRSCQQLLGRPWTEDTLGEACRLVLGEIAIPGSAPGGRVEFRRTLLVSFLFRFYLQVLQELKTGPSPGPLSPRSMSVQPLDIWHCPQHRGLSLSALEDLPAVVPRGTQTYQRVNPQQPSEDPVGRPVMHLSGLKHATGEAVFCDDLPKVDRELSMALVTSTRPHAKIMSVDPSEALRLPGVVDVIMATDIPGTNGTEDDRLLAVDEVLCVGQVICAVVAETDVQAKRAAGRVRVTYEDLEPVILSIQDAVKHNSFLCPEKKLEQGNVDEAFEKADHVVEGEVHAGGQEHFYMETQRVLVVPKAEDQELDIFTSTQDPAHVQKTVSSTLNVPLSRVTCHVKRVGGGFGGKVVRPAVFGAIAAVGAIK